MDERDRRGRDIQDTINRILYEDWNPLGFAGVPPDEYTAYAGGVYRLLASGASSERVAEHLADLERNAFGNADASATRCMTTAKKLCGLDVRVNPRSEPGRR